MRRIRDRSGLQLSHRLIRLLRRRRKMTIFSILTMKLSWIPRSQWKLLSKEFLPPFPRKKINFVGEYWNTNTNTRMAVKRAHSQDRCPSHRSPLPSNPRTSLPSPQTNPSTTPNLNHLRPSPRRLLIRIILLYPQLNLLLLLRSHHLLL